MYLEAEMTATVLTALGVCTLVPYIVYRCKKKLVPGIFLKIATSMFFILTASAAILEKAAHFDEFKYLFIAILVGLVFGLLGDYWLDMKDLSSEHHDQYMFAGFSSFYICHLFFNAGLIFTYAGGWSLKEALIVAVSGVIVAAGVMLAEKIMKMDYGKYKLITIGYGFIFGISLSVSFLCWMMTKNLQPLVMNIGIILFLLSDVVLSGTYFGGKKRAVDYALNYIFYYGAQFTIALSLLAVA